MRPKFSPNGRQLLRNGVVAFLLGTVVFVHQTMALASAPFGTLRPGLSADDYEQAILGRSFFSIPWVAAPSATSARDGLGPLFNANSCVSCHVLLGKGDAPAADGLLPRSLIVKTASAKDPAYGGQIQINAIAGVPFEATATVQYQEQTIEYPDGHRVVLREPRYLLHNLGYGSLAADSLPLGARLAPALIGLGLLEKIPDADILHKQDPFDLNGDGISGRANWVQDHAGVVRLGRYNWKASSYSVEDQSLLAMFHDMGLTSEVYSSENCTRAQLACQQAPVGNALDITAQRVQAISRYLSNLQVPVPAKQNISRSGQMLFDQVGCSGCHVRQYTLPDQKVIAPYSDLLLHDMGEGLADSRVEHAANGREWRTAPLWGISLVRQVNPDAGFLHDGRAKTLEQAILWHAGEALKVVQRFRRLSKAEREALLKFLETI